MGLKTVEFEVLSWGRSHRVLSASVMHATISGCALYLAFFAIFQVSPTGFQNSDFRVAVLLLVVIRVVVNYVLKLPVGRWSMVGNRDFLRLAITQTTGSTIFFLVAGLYPLRISVPISVIVLEWALGGYITMTLWVGYRLLLERAQALRDINQLRVVVIGAGEAGRSLVGQMLRSPWGYRPVAYLDDDPLKWNTSLHGLNVIGGSSSIDAVTDQFQIDEIVISMPSADVRDVRRIVESCE